MIDDILRGALILLVIGLLFAVCYSFALTVCSDIIRMINEETAAFFILVLRNLYVKEGANKPPPFMV